jgi:hypothetical protein
MVDKVFEEISTAGVADLRIKRLNHRSHLSNERGTDLAIDEAVVCV